MPLSFTEDTQKTKTTLWRDERGAAYVEALSIIPFFLIVWVGLNFMYNIRLEKQARYAGARTCAWEWSNQGCEGEKPKSCIDSTSGGEKETEDFGGQQRQMTNMLRETQDGNWANKVIGAIFGESFETQSEGTVTIPGRFGGGQGKIRSNYYLLCNERPQEVGDIVKKVACELPGAEILCGG